MVWLFVTGALETARQTTPCVELQVGSVNCPSVINHESGPTSRIHASAEVILICYDQKVNYDQVEGTNHESGLFMGRSVIKDEFDLD